MVRNKVFGLVLGLTAIIASVACSGETPATTPPSPTEEPAIAHAVATTETTLTRAETATLKLINESQMRELKCVAGSTGSDGTYKFIALATKTLAPTFDPVLSDIAGMASVSDVEGWIDCGINFNQAFGMSSEKLKDLLAGTSSPATKIEVSNPAPKPTRPPVATETPDFPDDDTPDYNDDCMWRNPELERYQTLPL